MQRWPDRSTTTIAEHVGCSHQWVSEVRATLPSIPVATACNPATDSDLYVIAKDGKRQPRQHAPGFAEHRVRQLTAIRSRLARSRFSLNKTR